MPLLMCPNCNASMSEVKRDDVAFDMCPTCRGVWLDRGELEKIIAGAREERTAFEQDRSQFYQDPDAYRRSHPQPPPHYQQRPSQPQQGYGYGERGEHGERGEYTQDGRRRRRGGFDLFDIFD
ncbi:MAG: zf-TFIIB domain-containing protein [Hyphomonadaceae bacterium]|nr:zf-TFIIB domain-containing protein [Hyphomonadaceae bacterium]